jgi:hypothetical protein
VLLTVLQDLLKRGSWYILLLAYKMVICASVREPSPGVKDSGQEKALQAQSL